MRLPSFLAALLIAIFLTACGGGGGSPGLSSGSNPAFSVAAPAAVTLQLGLSQQYAVKGGVKPYSVYSNNPAIVSGWFAQEDVLAIGTLLPGTATVTVVDVKGSKFDIAVTSVGSSTAFFTTAPGALTMAPGPMGTQTFKLGGGTPPYKATSNFPAILSVVVNGTDVTFTALKLPGAATVTITDSANPPASLSSNVTLGTLPLAVNPSNPTIATGSVFRAVITGGTPPYRTLILDNCLTDVKIVQGNIVEAKGNKPCTGAALSIIDANDQTVSFTVTVNVGTSILQLAPSAFTIPESPSTPTLSLLLYGANPGPLNVFTTNTAILPPQTPVANADGTYTIALTGGNTCSAAGTGTPAVAGVDNTNPPDGDFTDTVVGPPGQPAADVAPVAATPATPLDITITVIDSTGRIGTSVVTITPGC